MRELAKDVHRLARLGVHLISISNGGVTVHNGAESSLVVEVKEMQDSDPILLELKGVVNNQRVEGPTVRRSDHGPWSVFVDRDFPYQPVTQTTVDQHGPSIDPRSIGLTVDEDQQPVS
ncbi:hypothetical protein MTR67_023492 [Solanum verrucosum]|uniref:Uncharacterized protein n=1 Tax=Solanum verrucosum TaxID=315347 RepID=A0AAF0QWX4_SOLVR|nr:hypothetical protein MTR67_023492 [Solanum verrucosum]